MIVDSDGSRNRISPMPRSLYPEEKKVLRQFYGNSFDVDSIKIGTSINNTRHQVAGEKQIRMRSEDFHQYTVKDLMDIDCGFQFYEEIWLGELRLGTTDVKAGLIHEGFHIYQRSKGLNVTS